MKTKHKFLKLLSVFIFVISLVTTTSFAAKIKIDSVPFGASAKCKDGTYSYSAKRSGTCSGHKGVSKWYIKLK